MQNILCRKWRKSYQTSFLMLLLGSFFLVKCPLNIADKLYIIKPINENWIMLWYRDKIGWAKVRKY